MTARGILALPLLCLLAGAAPVAAAAVLPDSAVIARVDDRVISAKGFADAYRDASAEFRPAPDSLGYVEFLSNMVNKELMGITATASGAELSFEDRLQLREYSDRLYANVLFERAVMDSVSVTEDETRAAWDCYKRKYRLRRILFADRPTAERIRRDLVGGRVGWSLAVRRYSIAPDRANDGELGWQDCQQLGLDFASAVQNLQPGQISTVLESREGYDLAQLMERRDVDPPAYEGMRTLLRDQILNQRAGQKAEAIQTLLSERIGLEVDSVNVAWAAKQFSSAHALHADAGGPTLAFDTTIPDIAPADTGRVLARWKNGGVLTLHRYLDGYSQLQPLTRPNINDYWLLRGQVIATATDPYTTQLAVERGYDKAPIAVELIRRRREELLVEHLYRDSVESRVWVSPKERRAYYEKHKNQYITFAKVTYGAISRVTRAGADSVVKRLRGGDSFAAILASDSLLGIKTGSIQERLESDKGSPFYRVLMEEMKPGQINVEGPDKHGEWMVLQILKRDDGRQLSFEEAQHYVDDALQNLKSEESLKAFLSRLRKRHKVEIHPELVMRAPGL